MILSSSTSFLSHLSERRIKWSGGFATLPNLAAFPCKLQVVLASNINATRHCTQTVAYAASKNAASTDPFHGSPVRGSSSEPSETFLANRSSPSWTTHRMMRCSTEHGKHWLAERTTGFLPSSMLLSVSSLSSLSSLFSSLEGRSKTSSVEEEQSNSLA